MGGGGRTGPKALSERCHASVRVCAHVHARTGDAVADEVPDDGANTCVQHVLEEHVAHVLVAHRARLEGCKASLHQEDQAARKQDVEGVRLLLGQGEGFGG